VLAYPAARALAFGGKGVGSQGDGCAQFVARDCDSREDLAARLQHVFRVSCLPLTIVPV